MNCVILSGNLGNDPELRHTASGKAVCSFRIGTQEYKDETEWHNVVCWDVIAEVAGKYLTKGSRVNILGRIQHTKSESNGKTFYRDQVVVSPGGLEFVGKAPKDRAAENRAAVVGPKPDVADDPDGDIPF
jgi:single-strand DNA-binding protein